jgi:hypothetical protein
MSDESTPSLQANMAEVADTVEQAVESNQEESSDQSEGSEPSQELSSSETAEAAKAAATLKNPKASTAAKQEAKKQLKKIMLKVDGEEFEEEYDPNDENYIREQLQLAKVSRKRMQEKALIEKDVLQFLEDMKKNPRKALSDPAIGLDLKKFAEDIIKEEIENSKKSPVQLEKEKLEQELRELKEERDREKSEREEKEKMRLTEQEFERLDTQMSQALEKHKFPKNPAIIKRMADYLMVGLEAKKDISVEDIIPLIKEDLKNDYRDILNSFPSDEDLEEYIGKEFVDRIRRKNIAKAKKGASNPAVKTSAKTLSTGKASEPKKEEKSQSFKDFFKF